MFLEATYLHVRNTTSQVVSMAAVVATGIRADGGREVLGVDVGDSEDEVFWRAFFTDLKRRGLSGVRLVISDQHTGLVAALKRCFQGAGHQRCRLYFVRNLLALVPESHADMVAAVFRFAAFPRPHWADAAVVRLVGALLTDTTNGSPATAATSPKARWPLLNISNDDE